MRVRIPVLKADESVTARIPKSFISLDECPKMNLNKIIEDRIRVLLNSIFGIISNEDREQEKRRKLVRLYIKQAEHFLRVISLLLASKHMKPLQILEEKTYRLAKYNREQEKLADDLVYRCNDLKTRAPCSYDIERAQSVLIRKKPEFPLEVLNLAQSLSMQKSERTEYPRIDSLMRIHVIRSSIWQRKDVKFSCKNGTLILDSYGFRSTLVLKTANLMLDAPGMQPVWHILSIEALEYDGKHISPKTIKGDNVLLEIVHATKYIRTVLEVENVFRILKEKAEKKQFELSVTGTPTKFEARILGVFQVQVGIATDEGGPSPFCVLRYKGTPQVIKQGVLDGIFSAISSTVQAEYTKQALFSVEHGLTYRGSAHETLRELQKEYAAESTTAQRHLGMTGITIKEKTTVLFQEKVLQLAVMIKSQNNSFLGVMHAGGPRLFYGQHLPGIIPKAHEICINTPSQGIYIETECSAKSLIETIRKKPKHFFALLDSYRSIRALGSLQCRLIINKNMEIVVADTISLKLEGKDDEVGKAEVIGPRIQIKDKMHQEQARNILWLSVLLLGITDTKKRMLGRNYDAVIVSGMINYPKNREDEIMFLENSMKFSLSYAKSGIFCSAHHLLVKDWVTSAISRRNAGAFHEIFRLKDIILYPRLISTLSVCGLLGGSLEKAFGTSITYSKSGKIEIRWIGKPKPAFFRELEVLDATWTGNKIRVNNGSLFATLGVIAKLFAAERIAIFGSPFQVSDGARQNTFTADIRDDGIHCHAQAACKYADEVTTVMEQSTDPEKDLSVYNMTICTNRK